MTSESGLNAYTMHMQNIHTYKYICISQEACRGGSSRLAGGCVDLGPVRYVPVVAAKIRRRGAYVPWGAPAERKTGGVKVKERKKEGEGRFESERELRVK